VKPRSGWPGFCAVLVAMVAVMVGLPLVTGLFGLVQATVFIAMAVLALSQGFIWGYGGIMSFGQSAFFGLGGYTYAVAVMNMGDSTVPFVLAIVIPAVFAALLGYFMFYGRISDAYVGVITLTVTIILFNVVNSTAGDVYHIGNAPRLYKLLVFTIGGGIAGLAGCLFTNWGGFISPTVFSLSQSAQIIIFVLVGGLGTLIGPILGAVAIEYLISIIGSQQTLNADLILGVVLVAFVLLVPEGVVPVVRNGLGRLVPQRRRSATAVTAAKAVRS
jgi:ABC-type branched-subunit amino acid transport system permease subunit